LPVSQTFYLRKGEVIVKPSIEVDVEFEINGDVIDWQKEIKARYEKLKILGYEMFMEELAQHFNITEEIFSDIKRTKI